MFIFYKHYAHVINLQFYLFFLQIFRRRTFVGAKRRAESAGAKIQLELDGRQRRFAGQERPGRESGRVTRPLQVLSEHADYPGAQPENRQRSKRVRQARYAQFARHSLGQSTREPGIDR